MGIARYIFAVARNRGQASAIIAPVQSFQNLSKTEMFHYLF